MPEAQIKVKDLISLIKEHSSKGYIDIIVLESYIRNHKPKETENKPPIEKRRKVYNISANIQAINKYQNSIKAGNRKSFVCLYFQKHFNMDIEDRKLKIYPTDNEMWIKNENGVRTFIPNTYLNHPFCNRNFVTSEKELMEILNISKGTINTWKNKGIITQYNIKIRVEIDGIDYKYRKAYLKCYDLEDIKENLSRLKLK